MIQTRRLAAILAADVAGYSRLIGAHEEGTLNRLRSIRTDIIDPKITEHRGRHPPAPTAKAPTAAIVGPTGRAASLIRFVDPLRSATQLGYRDRCLA
jgi:class 3 adenylate cyclase